MKTLLDVKNELAKEHGYEDWAEWCRAYNWFPHKYHDEVAKLYATECIKASLERASDNAKAYERTGLGGVWLDIDKSTITDPKNIVLL